MQVNEASAAYAATGEVQDVPPGYKRTEVGVIPADWEVATLATPCKRGSEKRLLWNKRQGCAGYANTQLGCYIIWNTDSQ